MVIEKTIRVELNRSKTFVENMDIAAKENAEKCSNDSTLYNFGYAPKEVIERFQCFCYQYPSLTEAIQSLLERDKLLKTKYRFMTPAVTYQMLAKPTSYDEPNSVRLAMVSLHKYMKQGRYKSVADAIEELLFGVNGPLIKTKSVGVNTTDQLLMHSEYSMISVAEHEALCKIANVVMQKLQQMPISDPKFQSKNVLKTPKIKVKTHVVVDCLLPNEKKSKASSPKDKLKVKNISPVRQKQKPRKLSADPEYFPKGTRKCLWKKRGKESPDQTHSPTYKPTFSPLQEHEPFVDVELLTPLRKYDANHKFSCEQQSIVSRDVNVLRSNPNNKTIFMLENLGLVPTAATCYISSPNDSRIIDLTSKF